MAWKGMILWMDRLATTLISATALALATMATGAMADPASGSVDGRAQLTLEDLRTFTDVFNQVRRNYIEPVGDRALLESAIEGMLADLDPHSAYLAPDAYEDLENSSRGRYVGVGFEVRAQDGRLVVRQVIAPSPADSAGIEPGDIITSIDGKPVSGRPLQQSIDAISGPEGSTVGLTVLRPGADVRTVELQRAFVKLPALTFRLLDGRFGYFHLVYFHRDSATDLKSSLDSIRADGIGLQGLILDVRSNPGGVLQPAVDMADGFLDEGTIVTTRGRNESMQVSYSANPGQWLPPMPLVLLVDRGTASAAEVLAGALQDHRRAIVVGERTFGKGSVQTVLSLRNGAGLKLTTARYYTPSGRSIQAEGIVPDLQVPAKMTALESADARKREVDLNRHLDQEQGSGPPSDPTGIDPAEDFPLLQALNVLRGIHALAPPSEPAPRPQ